MLDNLNNCIIVRIQVFFNKRTHTKWFPFTKALDPDKKIIFAS